MAKPSLVDLVEHIARALVDAPNAVEVREVQDGDTTVLELRVAKDDLGKVIGKQGTTARAIRSVLAAACTKLRRRAVLDIVED
jgi:predicted RNA-binding protein YlqC (UPF0109 family)